MIIFYTDKSLARIQQWHTMISPYLANDTGEDMMLQCTQQVGVHED